jgi:hypothetical protein
MRRRHNLSPRVEGVEQRLSLSAPGTTTSAISAADDASVQRLELENTLISSYSVTPPAPHPGGSQQIIAILIG